MKTYACNKAIAISKPVIANKNTQAIGVIKGNAINANSNKKQLIPAQTTIIISDNT
jgi:hypothetical protein